MRWLAAGIEAKTERRAVVQQLARDAGDADVTPFELLLDIREDKAGADPGQIRANCLRSIWNVIRRLVEYVDRMEDQQMKVVIRSYWP